MSEEIKTSELDNLKGMVADLTGQVKKLSEKKVPGSGVVRNQTKEHTAFMREYSVKEVPVGLVTKIYDVKEVQDKTESRRYIGLCKIDVLNPRTGEVKMFKDIDYIDFLDACPKVLVSIVRWEKTPRYVEDSRNIDVSGRPLEVGFTDHEYTLKVMEGAFAEETFIHSGTGLNV